MRSRYRVNEPHSAHFITSTIVEWIPLFISSTCCDLIIESLRFCQMNKALQIYGWVIMPNHFHAIVSASDLSGVIADFKKITARRILEHLEKSPDDWALNQFAYYKAGHKAGAHQHQVWQEGFYPKAIASDESMIQKLEYMHNNPVRAGLVVSPEHWRYSSAHEWLPGAIPLLRCDSWR